MASARLESWTAIGGMVARARNRAGFSQSELGDRLGLHRSSIARIELGQRHLDALELARLAETLGRSVEWFLTEPPTTIASHRGSLSGQQQAQRLEDELERTCRDVELLTDVRALSLPISTLQSGVTSLEEAEDGARQARILMDQPDGPLLDLQFAVESVGLLGFSLDLGPSEVDGGYVQIGGVGVALVNGTADAGRRRFTLAHELGHHLLADEYTADFGLGWAQQDREVLINAFAAHLLMPGHSLLARWADLSHDWQDERSRLIVLAAEYRVSWSALVSHAVTLELVTGADLDSLLARRPTRADYLETGVRFEEELAPISLAPTFSQATIRAFRRGLVSADRAVELLRDTIAVDDLPQPNETPIEALASEFQTIE